MSSGTGFTVAPLEVRPEFDEGWGEDADEPAEPDAITRQIAPTQALQESAPSAVWLAEAVSPKPAEGEHYGAVHHDYRTPRDLPELGGQR